MSAYESWRFEVALHSQPDDPLPVFDTDITPYVDGLVTARHGRPSELDSVEAGELSWVVNDADHRFTPGNTSSPYYPYWKQARQVRVVDTIGYRSFPIFQGWLELPDITDWAESGDQLVAVTAVDRLTRLDRGRKFITTLAEYVLHNGGTALKGYWPLADASGSSKAAEATGRGLAALSIEGTSLGLPVNPYGSGLISFGSVQGPSGDDGSYPRFNPLLNVAGNGVSVSNRLAVRDLGAISMVSNAYFSVVGWALLDPTNTGSYQVFLVHDNVGTNSLQIGTDSAGHWQLLAANIAGLATVTGPVVNFGSWQMIAARLNNATGAVDLWVDGTSYAGSCGGASNGTMDVLIVDDGSPNQSAGHAQVYAGASTDFDRTKFDAQRSMASTGLAGQTTGARIRTLAAYAGMPSAQLQVDNGATYMDRTRLAGQSPLAAMKLAESTERGVLFADGAVRLVFQDRVRRNNI